MNFTGKKIENNKYVIYQFEYPGSFVTTSNYSGLTIMDSNVALSRYRIDRLPCNYFDGKPIIDNLKMINVVGGFEPSLEKDTFLTPLKRYSKQFNGLDVNITEYKQTYGTAICTELMEGKFGSLKETKDSLIFYDVKR